MRRKLGMLILVGSLLATAQALGGAPSGPDAACPPGCCVEACSAEAIAASGCEPGPACPMPCAPTQGSLVMEPTVQ